MMEKQLPDLSRFPRRVILRGPTPLEPLPRLSDRLGVEVWVKRDDLAGPSIGGNKSRQLEYYLGAAEASGADTILITGAVQSNFARLAAATARAAGMHAIVQLEERVPGQGEAYQRSGNVALLRRLGAEIMRFPEGENEAGADAALFARAEALRAEGRVPYVIPLSAGHPPLGALGYVQAAAEIVAQKPDFDVVVTGSGSGATHCGLLAGFHALGHAVRVLGGCVRRPAPAQRARLTEMLPRLADMAPELGRVPAEAIHLWDGALAPGYGLASPASDAAERLLAETEGLLVDPVYTAKSLAALPALVADGTIPRGARVCFVHTGGLAALFAYAASGG